MDRLSLLKIIIMQIEKLASNKKRGASLLDTHPELVRQLHPDLNGALDPNKITRSYKKELVWLCEKGHIWREKVSSRTRQVSPQCMICISLGYNYPDLVEEIDFEISNIDPFLITPGSQLKIGWNCKKCKKRYFAVVNNRTHNRSGCPYCSHRIIVYEKSLAFTHPEISKQFDSKKNYPLTTAIISQHYRKNVYWACEKGHQWEEPPCNRAKRKEANCKICDSVALKNPDLIKEWHEDNTRSPYDVSTNSSEMIKWRCLTCSFIWMSIVVNRFRGSGCPGCIPGWTLEKIRSFVSSLLSYLDKLTEVELYVILQQAGLFEIDKENRSKYFVQALKTGKFPKEELEKFAHNQPSLVDEFINSHDNIQKELLNDELLESISEYSLDNSDELKIIETKDVLSAFDNKTISGSNAETIDFFIKSAVAKIWKHVFLAESKAHEQLVLYNGDNEYAHQVRTLFLSEYNGAKSLKIPEGYKFGYLPNLMQLYTAYLIQTRKRIGNWSGTGAGKTLAAILASRVINAGLTVICCPNNVVDNWIKKIQEIYPHNSCIYTKNDISDLGYIKNTHQYLVLNYEFFQQPKSEEKLKELLANNKIDFVVIDEIHFSKQRNAEISSKRKKLISSFLSQASSDNENIHVLGMSATPVINDLFEGKTLIELVTGLYHDDLDARPTVSNCINLYKKFVSHGIRYIPDYKQQLNEKKPEVDCFDVLDQIKKAKSYVELEAVLTKVKIPIILNNLQPKTIVYTHYSCDGIELNLQESIAKNGWRVGLFNGNTKDDLDKFINGDIDVLISTRCIGTGVDGLQKVCNRLIINCLPWTHAEYKQLIGRLYRQGQTKEFVDIIIPITYAMVNSERWSWCESRWKRIEFKKTIADAAVDGVIPQGHLRSLSQAYKDSMKWLEQISEGKDVKIERKKIEREFLDEAGAHPLRTISDLTRLNQQINKSNSSEIHAHFSKNPEQWYRYHEVYREKRKEWEVVPYQEAIKWCNARPNLIVGDFGCGEAFLAQELKNKVFSFDHIATNDKVVAVDMVKVPLDNSSLDVVVFSLSLMGTNWVDYLLEAHRCLKLDAHLWIAEPISRFNDINLFKDLLEKLGFDLRSINEKGKFMFIIAMKSERNINKIGLSHLNIDTLLS